MLLSIGIWIGFSQGMGEATRALLHWASASIALRHGRTNMDVPISIGVLLVTGMSLSALAAAFVSMSPSTAAGLSQIVADVVFQGNGLRPVSSVLAIAKMARFLILENIMLSVGYNLLLVPLAMLGYVAPWLAAAAMSGSSLIVILNSLRLSREQRS